MTTKRRQRAAVRSPTLNYYSAPIEGHSLGLLTAGRSGADRRYG